MTAKKGQPKKRGVKSYYDGSRLAFLEQHFAEYISLRGKSRHDFWHRLYNIWWECYPWRLSDDKEPPTDDPEKMAELLYVGGDEDKKAKGEVEGKTRKRIAAWFSNRGSSRALHEGGVWAPILKHIHKKLNPKPRCRSAAQQFMHEEPTVIKTAFETAYGEGIGMKKIERLNKLNETARELTTTRYAEMVPELERRAKEAHEQEKKEWELDLDKIEEAEDVSLARDGLFNAVYPLLQFIGRYSGCYVTLLAAAQEDTDDKPYFSVVHHIPQEASVRINWSDYNKQGFQDGVVHPFFKYIRWMEDTRGEHGEVIRSTPSTTTIPTPSMSPALSALPKTIPTFQQSRKSKKRAFTYSEDSSDDEEDVDMDIDSNDGSGSSVDSDHIPAKRLRTATIITRSSATTPDPTVIIRGPSIHQDPPSFVGIHPPNLDNLNTEAETEHEAGPDTDFETEPETGIETGTELNAEIPDDTRLSSPGTHSNPTEPTTTSTTRTLHHSPTVDADVVVNGSGANLGTANAVKVSIRRVRKPINIPVAPRQLPSPSPVSVPDPGSPLEIPAFLIGKNNIYGYLSCVEETGFRDLLQAYIAFELADHSCIRSGHSTTNRPNAIGWWSSRAHPDKLPPYNSLKSFTKSITTWWISIQPHWRKIKPGKVSRIEEDWEYIYKPGINGFLNVVILAYWWARILEERNCDVDATYSWFVSDATWVLSQLTNAAHEGRF